MSVCRRILITCFAMCVLSPLAVSQSAGQKIVASLPRGTASLLKREQRELSAPEGKSRGFSVSVIPADALERQVPSEKGSRGDYVAIFQDACHFPAEPGGAGGGLVIYDGMELYLSSNGDYTASFFAEIPRSCVTVRLRFSLCTVVDGEFVPCGAIIVSPVVLKSSSLLSSQFAAETVRVEVSGNSPAIPELLKEQTQIVVSRRGVARFGLVPEQGVYRLSAVAESQDN